MHLRIQGRRAHGDHFHQPLLAITRFSLTAPQMLNGEAVVEYLLAYGADPYRRDFAKKNAFDYLFDATKPKHPVQAKHKPHNCETSCVARSGLVFVRVLSVSPPLTGDASVHDCVTTRVAACVRSLLNPTTPPMHAHWCLRGVAPASASAAAAASACGNRCGGGSCAS